MVTVTRFCIFSVLLLVLSSSPISDAQDASPAQPLGPDRGWVLALTLSPNYVLDGRAWASVFGGRIFTTSNHLASWREARNGITDPVVTGLAVSPNFASDATIFAAADDGIFRSLDGGESWQNVSSGLNGHSCRVPVLSRSFGSDRIAYVATDAGVYRSLDGGTTWIPPADNRVAIQSLALYAGHVLLAGPSAGGLIRSLDGGQTWVRVTGFELARSALSIAVSPVYESDSTILVGTDDGVWVTRDGGTSWARAAGAGERVPAVSVSPDFAHDSMVVAATAGPDGLLLSTSSGANWRPVGSPSALEAVAISPGFNVDRTIVVGTAGHGVYASSNGGLSWSAVNSYLHGAGITGMQVASSTVTACGPGGMSVSQSSGGWRELPVPSSFLNSCDRTGSRLAVATQDSGLLLSSDAGTTWEDAGLPSTEAECVAMSPAYDADGVIVAAAGYVYLTVDAGRTWSRAVGIIGNDVRRFRFASGFFRTGTIFAATILHGVLRSDDGGQTWISTSRGLPPDQITDVALSINYSLDGRIFAATAGHGVYTSNDRGVSWSALGDQPSVPVVTALAWEGATLIAGTEKGIFKRTTNGWIPLGSNWNEYVTHVVVTPVRDGYQLFVGTLGDGVWAVPDVSAPTPTTLAPPTLTPTVPPAPTAVPVLHLKLIAFPNPLIMREPGLLILRGPVGAQTSLDARSGTWKRHFVGTLARDGSVAFGFVTPTGPVTVSATALYRGTTLHYHVVLLPVPGKRSRFRELPRQQHRASSRS